ncbi:hypothetical protein HY623_03240 [Candidatus Uhrbacteria bacterium]|nr:hypothetical protein [Candidatus Uhrbacteria bacterium]
MSVIGAAFFLFPGEVSAQEGIIPQCAWAAGETYGLGAFTLLAINVLKFIWGILGSLALVMFVWGGFLWLTARGEENQIKQGWDTLVNAAIGLLIVLGSWLIINTIILSLTTPGDWSKVARVFSKDWSELVRGDICVNVAASVKSWGMGKAASGSAATGGGDGVCCLESNLGAVFNKGVNEDRCKQLLIKLANNGASRQPTAYYCPSSVDESVCGNKEIRGGARYNPDDKTGEYWRMNCSSGQVVYSIINKGDVCADDKKICREPYVCLPTGGGKKCVDENEQGKCVLVVSATLGSETKKIVATFDTGTKRDDCKGKTYPNTTITMNSQSWTITGVEYIQWCEQDASDGSVWSSDSSPGINAVEKEFGRWGRTCVSVK